MTGLEAFLARLGAILGRTWTDLGAQEGPKGRPKGIQEAPKTSPKLHEIFDRNFDRFWTDFGGPGEIRAWPGGLRGAWLDSLSSKNSKKISKTIQTRSDPSGGGGLPPLRGNTAARPPFFVLPLGLAVFCLCRSLRHPQH